MKEKNKKINRRNKSMTLIFLLLLIVSIGFAYLTSNLSIFGSSILKGGKWDVHFENVKVSSEGVQINTPQITNNRTTVEYDITLDKPGDFVEFTVDAKNAGTIDAMIETITPITLYDGETKLNEIPDYLDYSITYADDEEVPIAQYDLLGSGEKVTYRVHVEYKKDITKEQLVKTKKNLKAEFDVTYEQADKNAYPSKIIQVIEGDGHTFGSEVAIADEHFYILDTNAEETLLFAKYNLLNDTNWSPSTNVAVEAKQASDTGTYGINFATDFYWARWDRNSYNYFLKPEYDNDPAEIFDSNSLTWTPVKNYEEYIETLGVDVLESRLITESEAITAESKVSNIFDFWTRTTQSWISTAKGGYNPYPQYLTSNGGPILPGPNPLDPNDLNEMVAGVRPVLKISTSLLP